MRPMPRYLWPPGLCSTAYIRTYLCTLTTIEIPGSPGPENFVEIIASKLVHCTTVYKKKKSNKEPIGNIRLCHYLGAIAAAT